MAFPLRIATCLLLTLLCASGCRPFQPGSLSRLQQPLPTSEEQAWATERTPLQKSRSQSDEAASIPRTARTSAQSQQPETSGSQPLNSAELPHSDHASHGYCAACGVTHGSSNGPPDFKFTQPLPQFQPVRPSTSQQPSPASLPDQSSSKLSLNEATYSSAIRVRPQQPEEARAAHNLANKPAPQPQPDDEPSSLASTESPAAPTEPFQPNAQPQADTLKAATFAAKEIEPSPSTTSPTEKLSLNASPVAGDDSESAVKLAAETKPSGSDSNASDLTAGEEPDSVVASSSKSEPPQLNLVALQQTLQTLRAQAESIETSDLGAKLESELVALDLLAGRVEQLAAGDADATQAQKSCQHQIAALVATLQPDALDISRPEGRTTATATLDHLRQAITQLESLVSLKVTRGALCSEIRGFGQYKPFPGTEFRTGQAVLLYCELENFRSTATPETNAANAAGVSGFCTRLKSSLVICREDGSVAQQAEFPVVEDIARNRRRDFYLYVPFNVGELPTGKYRVHLLVDDLLGCKQAVLDPPVEFTVR